MLHSFMSLKQMEKSRFGGEGAYYHLQRSCGKVMFLHQSVILFRGILFWQTPPPPADIPSVDTHPLGRHPPGRLTPGQTPPGRHPPEMATAEDSMHPTGMHSCFAKKFHTSLGRLEQVVCYLCQQSREWPNRLVCHNKTSLWYLDCFMWLLPLLTICLNTLPDCY